MRCRWNIQKMKRAFVNLRNIVTVLVGKLPTRWAQEHAAVASSG